MSVLNQSGEEQVECPLCMEPLEVDDLNFYPCTCGYQICRFCWHRIRTDENGLCPACRKAYSENPADFTPLSKEQVAQLKADKRQRDQQRKAKLSESRKHLASVRVVQKNLVFVVGLPVRLADADVLKRHEYFGKFGKIHKVVINQSTSYAGSQGPSASAYVTYVKSDDALRAIQSVNNITLDGRLIKSSLGTTKYCSHFMKNQPCPKADCMYLHDFGDPEASFTKEQMHVGKHQEYEKKLHDALVSRTAAQQQREQQQQQQPNTTTVNNSNSSTTTTSSSSTTTTTVTSAAPEKAASTAKQNGTNWPTLFNNTTTETATNSATGFGNINKTDKQQKSESKAEKSQKKSNNQKNKNNNNTSSTNNNIENSKKDKSNNKNCEQTNCQHNQTNHTQSQQQLNSTTSTITVPTNIQEKPLPMAKSKSNSKESLQSVSTSSVLSTSASSSTSTSPPSTNNPTPATTADCCLVDGLSKIQLIDDNSSFFSHNSFQKIIPDQDSSSYSTDSSSLTPHSSILNDNLPDITSSEDWQAAFGFSTLKSDSPLQQSDSLLSCASTRSSAASDNYHSENGFVKLDHVVNQLDHFSKPQHQQQQQQQQQQSNFDILKAKESILDALSSSGSSGGGRNSSHFLPTNNGMSSSFNKHLEQQQTNEQRLHPVNYINSKLPDNGGINGLDQQMSKFFAEFNNKNNQKDVLYNGFNHQTNGFVQNTGDRQNYIGNNQINQLADSQHNLLLLNQYQQRFLDKHMEEQALYNLKQNVFHSQQQQQPHQSQQFLHSSQLHHSGSQQFMPNGVDHFLNQNGQSFQNSGYTQNAVFQQRNQIQLRDRPSVDDDLGFDPFHETQKALAELIESEQGTLLSHQAHSSNGASPGMLHGGGVSTTGPGSCLPPPPPGFMQHNAHMNSFGSKILPYLNMSSSQQISTSGGWSTNYSEAQLKGVAPVNDWMTLDPAIVSSSRHFPLASLQPPRAPTDQYTFQSAQGPTQQQQQQQQQLHQQQQQQQQSQSTNAMRGFDYASHASNGYSAPPHSYYLNGQPNGLGSWFGAELHGPISSPPGFRQSAAQTKTQEYN